MDTIFYNGNICTLDKAYPVCSAVGIKNGIITALGEGEEVLNLAGEETEKIDLAGAFAAPGFVDSHMHFIFYAMGKRNLDLSHVKSLKEALALCGEKARSAERGKWVYGGNFNQDDWIEKRLPTREELDLISKEIPIVMQRACLHISVCNTKALELSGLAKICPDGIVSEQEQNAISEAMPLPTIEELKELILEGAEDVAKAGITEVHTDDFTVIPGDQGELIMEAYRQLSAEGRLKVRIYEQCNLETASQLQSFLDRGHRTGDDYGFFRVGPLKIITDGSMGAHTAAMLKAYRNAPETKGIYNYTDEELETMVSMAQAYGMQTAIHCIGDGALEQALGALRKAHYENPKADLRHGIVHCQIMSKEQQDWFRKLNLLAYIQPVFVRYDMHIVEECVGEELAASSYNWRRFAKLGVHQCGGSDCPVEHFDVLSNIYYAVTRKDPERGKCWHPENGLTALEALRCFTEEGAYASRTEAVKGTLTVGKYADLVVLDKDILAIPPEEIRTTSVLLTMTGGRITYKAAAFQS